MKNLLLFLSSLFFLVSCEKAETDSPSLLRLDSETSSSEYVIRYYYNEDGRIKATKFYGRDFKLTTYTYINNIIYVVNSIDSVAPFDSTILILNSNGYVEKSVHVESDPLYKTIGIYIYDDNGHLIEDSIVSTSNGTMMGRYHHLYTIENGNTTVCKTFYSNYFHPTEVVSYENYTFLTNVENTITNETKGMAFYGKSNINPYYQWLEGNVIIFSYEYDEKNRIIKRIQKNGYETGYTTYIYKD